MNGNKSVQKRALLYFLKKGLNGNKKGIAIIDRKINVRSDMHEIRNNWW